jgi:ribosome recycling factor
MQKAGGLTRDEAQSGEFKLDKYVASVDKNLESKEAELMKI